MNHPEKTMVIMLILLVLIIIVSRLNIKRQKKKTQVKQMMTVKKMLKQCVPLKYLSNSSRTLYVPLINRKILT